MIKINQIKLPVGHKEKELKGQIRKILRLSDKDSFSYEILKRSLDARKKPNLFYVYTVQVKVDREAQVLKRVHHPSVSIGREVSYAFPSSDGQDRNADQKTAGAKTNSSFSKTEGTNKLQQRPVIVGAGPAGLFAAYQLTEAGYAPVILERGKPVEERKADVEHFWETGVFAPDSNVQFGEGGAGTFSDGKLNTGVKDPSGRNRFVLETFVKFGAPAEILYDNKPHIGTDILASVIANMRKYLISRGAEFRFGCCVTDVAVEDGRLRGVYIKHLLRTTFGDIYHSQKPDECRENHMEHEGENAEFLEADAVIFAIGHSARDTFRMLKDRGIPMECKNFAVGFRVEHPQKMIDHAMYGDWKGKPLPAAPYKVTSNFPGGRGVYSFCMCPGGYVVNASSMTGGTCVNGMSYSGRNAANANSAIIVSVTPADFGGDDALSGMVYQEMLERKNFCLGGGKIPQQLFGDFRQNVVSSAYGDFSSCTRGETVFSNLRGLMSEEMEQSFMLGMEHFARAIPDFDRKDAILSGMETRTSSPVRILRDETGQSAVRGLYPCGEGAGYAGGIMSAAIDGLKSASAVMGKWPL
ncbi:MAG: FAD-dependent protein [Agathobacter sp.]